MGRLVQEYSFRSHDHLGESAPLNEVAACCPAGLNDPEIEGEGQSFLLLGQVLPAYASGASHGRQFLSSSKWHRVHLLQRLPQEVALAGYDSADGQQKIVFEGATWEHHG
jgi:hypothetical protein